MRIALLLLPLLVLIAGCRASVDLDPHGKADSPVQVVDAETRG